MKEFTVFLSHVYADPDDNWYWIQVLAKDPKEAERKATERYLLDLGGDYTLDQGDVQIKMICEGWFAFRFGDMSSPRLGARVLRQQKEDKKMRKQEKTKCLVTTCDQPAKTRGLCGSCYATAKRLIKDKRTTEKALIESGR